MQRKRIFKILLIILALTGLFIFDYSFKFGFGSKIATGLKPISIVLEQTGEGISNFFSNIKNIGKLQKENRRLNDELNKAMVEIAKLSEAEKENSSLKRDLGFRENNDFQLVAAKVVAFDPSNIRETITINVGKNKGLNNGDVVVSEGFLVGRIKEVSASTAKIILISDPESAIPATVKSSTITGIVKGTIGSGLNLDQVPQSEKVNMEDLILTSGLGGDFPKGIIIGRVDEVQRISGSIFQLIGIRPMVDLSKLERVMVIKR